VLVCYDPQVSVSVLRLGDSVSQVGSQPDDYLAIKERLKQLEQLLESRTPSPVVPVLNTPEPKPTAPKNNDILSDPKPVRPTPAHKSTVATDDHPSVPKKPSLHPAPACTQVKAPAARVEVDEKVTVAALQDIVRRLSKENDHLKGRLHNASCPSSEPSKSVVPPTHPVVQLPPVSATTPAATEAPPVAKVAKHVTPTPPVSAITDTSNHPAAKITTPATGIEETAATTDTPSERADEPVITTSTHRSERMQLGRLITSGKITVDTHPQILQLWNGSLKDLCHDSSCLVVCPSSLRQHG
jgi:hypothetical protein